MSVWVLHVPVDSFALLRGLRMDRESNFPREIWETEAKSCNP